MALEQGKKRVDDINSSRDKPEKTRVAELEEEIRRLGNQREFRRTGAERGLAHSCNTCTRPTHRKAACPGKTVRCYSCVLTGHFRGFKACRAKEAKDKAKNQMERVNQLDGSEDERDGDSVG